MPSERSAMLLKWNSDCRDSNFARICGQGESKTRLLCGRHKDGSYHNLGQAHKAAAAKR